MLEERFDQVAFHLMICESCARDLKKHYKDSFSLFACQKLVSAREEEAEVWLTTHHYILSRN